MEIGKRLKEAREDRGLTLEAVEEETKIRRKYLRALEEEQFQVLPGPVYAKAFLKTYTRFLGLNVEDSFESYNNFFAAEAPSEPLDKYVEAKNKAGVPRKPGFRLNYKVAVVIIGLVAVLLFSISWVMGRDNTVGNNAGEVITSEQTAPPSGQQPSVGQQQPDDSSMVILDLNVKYSNCWMRVTVDGERAFEGTLTPGQSKHFEGKDKIYVTLGNAGAVEVSLNGQNLGFMGNLGEVKDREFYAQPRG